MKNEKKAGVGSRVVREPSEFRDRVEVWDDTELLKTVSADEAANLVNSEEYKVRITLEGDFIWKIQKKPPKLRLIFDRPSNQAYLYEGKEMLSSYWSVIAIERSINSGKWMIKTIEGVVGQVSAERSIIEEKW